MYVHCPATNCGHYAGHSEDCATSPGARAWDPRRYPSWRRRYRCPHPGGCLRRGCCETRSAQPLPVANSLRHHHLERSPLSSGRTAASRQTPRLACRRCGSVHEIHMLIDDVLFPGTADRISRAFKPRESATRFGCGKSYVQPPIVVEVGNGHTRPVGPSLVKPMLRPRIVQRVFGVLQPLSPFHNVWLSVPVEIGDARSLSIGFRHADRSPGIRAVLEKITSSD